MRGKSAESFIGISLRNGYGLGLSLFGQSLGMRSFQGGVYGNLIHKGLVSVSDCTVNGESDFMGTLSANDSVFNGVCSVMGMVSATGCKFNDLLTVSTNSMTLTNCDAQDVHFGMLGNVMGGKELYLDGTTVHGNVVFANNDGTVHLRNGAEIRGDIIGANVAGRQARM